MRNILLALAAYFGPDDLPSLDDLARLPSYQMCDDRLAFLAARQTWLDGQRSLFADPMYAPWFDAATEDVRERRAPWALLYEARGWAAAKESMDERDERRSYPTESRLKIARAKLAELKQIIGRDYESGILPGPIDPVFWTR